MNAHVYRHSLSSNMRLLRTRKALLTTARIHLWRCLPLLQQPDCACVLRVSHVTEVLGLKTPSVQNAANRVQLEQSSFQ
jgi:hypothetical protein